MIKTSDYNFILPQELIAQHPPKIRTAARMMVVSKSRGVVDICSFENISHYLLAGDLLVLNDTKVINARLHALKNGLLEGAHAEFLLITPVDKDFHHWLAYAKPGKRLSPGTRSKVILPDTAPAQHETWITTEAKLEDGTFQIYIDTPLDIFDFIEKYGSLPLPPYIERIPTDEDKQRYQTVFAQQLGAIAAPTAGLHFTETLLNQLEQQKIFHTMLTLHTGPGTFKPVSVEDVTQHKMHSEKYILSNDSASRINQAKKEGRRIVAVGTTTVRTLESQANPDGTVRPGSGSTEIFLYPPYKPLVPDLLLTNFHLPKSTLIMLVSTFADRELILHAYHIAIKEKMRFYSYGDCMLIIP